MRMLSDPETVALPEPETVARADGSGRERLDHHPSSGPLLEIANATVRLYKTAFGRGPTRARARFAGPDTLVVLLQDTMTASERKLAELGEHERLRSHRLLLARTVEDDIRAVVEQILERETLGLISGIDTHRDVAAEVIVLAPASHLDPHAPA
jgi:uncharacterized protein YbcI